MTVLTRITLSPWNYWLVFVLDACMGTGALAFAVSRSSVAAAAPAGALAAATYSFYEYAFHRWLYHRPGSRVLALHTLHHAAPRAAIGAPFPFTVVVWATAWCVAGPAFAGALLITHVYQGAIHHLLHHSHLPLGGLRRHHLVHHRRGDCNYGVSTRWWDRLLGTRAR